MTLRLNSPRQGQPDSNNNNSHVSNSREFIFILEFFRLADLEKQ